MCPNATIADCLACSALMSSQTERYKKSAPSSPSTWRSYCLFGSQRGPPKGYIEAIEGRLQRLEALLESVIQEDDPRSKAILEELNAPLQTPYGELIRPRLHQQQQIPPTRTAAAAQQQPQQQQQQQTGAPNTSHHNRTSTGRKVKTIHADPELGNRYIDETGQIRYYGKASGYYMLRGSRNFKEGVFRFNSRGYRSRSSLDPHHTAEQTPNLVIDPFEKPPDDLAQHLLDLYFANYYPLFPILHKKSFLESLKSDNPPPLLLLNSIYALASRISDDPRVRTHPDLPDTAGDVFFERARLLLDYEWENFQVSTIQSLLLLSSHQTGVLKTVRGWLYSGLVKFNMFGAIIPFLTEEEKLGRLSECYKTVDCTETAILGTYPRLKRRTGNGASSLAL